MVLVLIVYALLVWGRVGARWPNRVPVVGVQLVVAYLAYPAVLVETDLSLAVLVETGLFRAAAT